MPDRGAILFAPSRYGPDVIGGAEAVQREIAVGLAKRGWRVEIATTCATDHYTWANELPVGTSELDGLPVHRFPAEPPLPERQVHEVRILAGEKLALSDQYRWLNTGMRSPALYHHILDHHESYRGIVLAPYPTWISGAASQIAAKRSVLWACLHDEPYARLDVFKAALTDVAGLLLMSGPEVDLLRRLIPNPAPHELVGCPVPIPSSYDPDGFRARFGIERPFVLYCGRREGGKGWDELLRMFERALVRNDFPLALVTFGTGPVTAPDTIADRVIDLGSVSDRDRDDAFAAATAYLQPSRYEAFSRTTMEAWLAGTPVVANIAGDVVRWHCERSGAGLTYSDAAEFEQCLSFLASAPDLARELAAPGRQYVLDNYDPDEVIDRVDVVLDRWLVEPTRAVP